MHELPCVWLGKAETSGWYVDHGFSSECSQRFRGVSFIQPCLLRFARTRLLMNSLHIHIAAKQSFTHAAPLH